MNDKQLYVPRVVVIALSEIFLFFLFFFLFSVFFFSFFFSKTFEQMVGAKALARLHVAHHDVLEALQMARHPAQV